MDDPKTDYTKLILDKYQKCANRRLRFQYNELDRVKMKLNERFFNVENYKPATEEEAKYFDKKLEDILEAEDNYIVSSVLKHPIEYSAGGFSEAMRDAVELSDLIPASTQRRKMILLNLGILTAFAAISVPHELIHAGTNALLGNQNKEIVINTLYGGSLWHKLIPSVKSEWLFPLICGYVDTGKISPLENMAVGLAPYAMTSFGIYALKKGIEKKCLPLGYLGAGLVAVHCGGIIGDFYNLGRTIINSAYEPVMNALSMNPNQDSTVENILIWGGGFYLGTKILSLTYTFSKGLVNSIRKYFKPTSSKHPRISGA